MDLTTSQPNEDLGFPHNQEPFTNPPPRAPQQKLTRLKVNLSTPLNVNTEHGENKAGPGDVVGHIGRHDVLMSKNLFIALLGREKYDDLVKKEMLKIRIAKRFDDALEPFNEEQIGQQKEEIEKLLKEAVEAQGPEFDPRNIEQVLQIVHSSEGPPTTKPDLYGTIVPGPMIPAPADYEEEDLDVGSEVPAQATDETRTEAPKVDTELTKNPAPPANPFTN